MRRESPTLEIFAHASHRQANTAFAFHQQHDGGTRPKRKVKLELLGALVANQALNLFFLRGGERAATACMTATLARIDAAHTVFLEAIDDQAHRRITQAKIASSLAAIYSAFVSTNHLSAAFMLCLWR